VNLRLRAAQALRVLPAPIRWRTHNAVALAQWLGSRLRGGADADLYADDFWQLQQRGDWDGFAALLLRVCRPASIVDVGCGDGKLLAAVRRQASLPLLGIDSSRAALARAASSGVAVEQHDLSSAGAADLEALRARVAAFDVAVSLETAEHLPPWMAARFARCLAPARAIVFSAAHPGQGGTLHMNERPPAYWHAHFAATGFRLSAEDASLRAAVAALDLPSWYAANIHLYERHA